MAKQINATVTKHVAQLANIPISDQEAKELANAFGETLEVVDQLQTLDVKKTQPTHQVTGLTNVFRADQVDSEKMLTQKQALKNAAKTHQGYFVVPRIIEK